MRIILGLALTICLSAASAFCGASRDLGNGFLDHGVATPNSNHRGTVATVDGQGRPIVLSWLMDHRGGYELLLIDVEAGRAQEFPVKFCTGDSPYASILSTGNKFYTHYNSHFLQFDPAQRAFTFSQKTTPQMAMSMTEDDQGAIWSVTYPQSGVVRFDPKTGQLKDYGQVYKQDWAQYPRYVAADDTGWLYFGIGSTACQVIAFDPQTGTATPMVPDVQRSHGTGYVYRGVDGKVYGQPNSSGHDNWFMFYRGQATRIGKRPSAAIKPIVSSSQGLFHGVFPGGKRIETLDLITRTLVVVDPKTKTRQTIHFDYQSEGAHIMGVAAAPDGTICGGTAFPMRFFRFDPKQDQWVNRPAYGQWNTVARQGDHFFAGIYGGGGLLEWNPSAAWVDTIPGNSKSNPILLATSAPTINRPHKLLAHPDGKTLVLAGTPDYGYTGGGLLFWDRATSKHVLLTHEDLIPQHSTMSLVALPGGKLLGGTTTSAGTGGQRKADQAELYLLDLASKRIQWHAVVFPKVQGYNDLCLGPDGLVWGFADAVRFFVFDPAHKKVVHEEATAAKFGPCVSHQGPRVFVPGTNGAMYVLFARAIARIKPEKWQIELLAKPPAPISAGGDMLDGRIYFAAGSHVHSFQVPPSSGNATAPAR